MGARDYDPSLGRFTSRDPILAHDYGYSYNNPVSFYDPSGLEGIEAVRDEMPTGLYEFEQPLGIEGIPEVTTTRLAFDEAGNFLLEAVGPAAEVAASSIFEPGELTPMQGVSLSTVEKEAWGYGLEAGAGPTSGAPPSAAQFFARAEAEAYYSDEGFASRGFQRGHAPEEGEGIGPVFRAGQKGEVAYSWGELPPASASMARAVYGPLTQSGEPDTLYAGYVKPGASFWYKVNPVTGITEFNVAPAYVINLYEAPLEVE